MSLLSVLASVLRLVPGVTSAAEAIARATRKGKPVKPIAFGREHLWDEVAAWQQPPRPVRCVYCESFKAPNNARELCPGPPKGPRRMVPR